jgi:chromosome segregation protein
VTPTGDRFGLSGWRVGAAGDGVTAAALADAEAQAAEVAERVAAGDALQEARRALGDAVRQRDANRSQLAAANAKRSKAEARRRESAAELEPLEGRIGELTAHLEQESARIAELEELLPELEAGEAAEAEAARTRQQARAELDARAALLTGRRRDLEVRAAGLQERSQFLQARIEDIERRLAADAEARIAAEARRVEVEKSLAVLDRLTERVEAHRAVLDAHHAELVERRRRQSEEVRALSAHLDQLRTQRTAAERQLDEVRERARRAELDEAEARLRLETAIETLRRELDVEPEVAEAAPVPPLPDGVTAPARVRELERELRLLGPINPLALQEYEELQQRHAFLEEQLEDVRTTRRELNRVIKAIDDEIQNVFASAYADVAENFTKLFTMLFPGGSGRLVLTDPQNLLTTGIEVEAKPSGKNVKKLSLLSGGERSLTALAFLFAVFRSRPSPFYVMDEVEAALDDVNLHRFLGLVAEFRREAQLLIVSHQKRTMEAGDCLLGVTMQPGGSSKVIVERASTATA